MKSPFEPGNLRTIHEREKVGQIALYRHELEIVLGPFEAADLWQIELVARKD